MADIELIFQRLAGSRFRKRFHLGPSERTYFAEKGQSTVMEHAKAFIEQRLAPAYPAKDGKQTPYRGHPVFIAQHATATCCRSCLAKWHDIERGHELSEAEQAYVLEVLRRWLSQQSASDG